MEVGLEMQKMCKYLNLQALSIVCKRSIFCCILRKKYVLLHFVKEVFFAADFSFLRPSCVCSSFKPVLYWANICFTNKVWGICQTATKLYSGSKMLRSTCSGNIRPFWWTLVLIGWEWWELSCGWGRNKNKNGWWCRYFTCFGGNWPICWLVGGAALSLGSTMI